MIPQERMVAWTRGNQDLILEVFELRAAEFADKHIPGKPSVDGNSYHYVRWCSQTSRRSRYHPHLTDAETVAQRGHSACPRTHSSVWLQRWHLSIWVAIPKSTHRAQHCYHLELHQTHSCGPQDPWISFLISHTQWV